jgi:hypothetical protein
MKQKSNEPKHFRNSFCSLWFILRSGALWWNGAGIIPSSWLIELIHQAFCLEIVSPDVTGQSYIPAPFHVEGFLYFEFLTEYRVHPFLYQ